LIAQDGTFELRDVPAGSWHVHFTISDRMSGWTAAPIANLELRAGETKELLIDGTRLMPSTLTGRLLVDGRPDSSAHLVISWGPCGMAGARFKSATVFALDSAGAFSRPIEPPACYHLEMSVSTGSFRGWFTLLDWFPAPPGTTIHRDFDLRTGKVRLRLLEADGTTPAAQRKVTFVLANPIGDECGNGTTNDDGWIELPPMPSVRLVPRVHLLSAEQAKADSPSPAELDQMTVGLEPFAVIEGRTVEIVRKLPPR
jgi:hypothetical protein